MEKRGIIPDAIGLDGVSYEYVDSQWVNRLANDVEKAKSHPGGPKSPEKLAQAEQLLESLRSGTGLYFPGWDGAEIAAGIIKAPPRPAEGWTEEQS